MFGKALLLGALTALLGNTLANPVHHLEQDATTKDSNNLVVNPMDDNYKIV